MFHEANKLVCDNPECDAFPRNGANECLLCGGTGWRVRTARELRWDWRYIESAYRALRAPYHGIASSGGAYLRQSRAVDALRGVRERLRTLEAWEGLEARGLVRLVAVSDEDSNAEDLCGMAEAEDGENERMLASWRKKSEEAIATYGAWGIVGQFRAHASAPWEDSDACWGFLDMGDGPDECDTDEEAEAPPMGASYARLVDVRGTVLDYARSPAYALEIALEAVKDCIHAREGIARDLRAALRVRRVFGERMVGAAPSPRTYYEASTLAADEARRLRRASQA